MSAIDKLLKSKGYMMAVPAESVDADIAQFRKAHPDDRQCNGVHALDFFITLSPYVMKKCIFCGQEFHPIRKAV